MNNKQKGTAFERWMCRELAKEGAKEPYIAAFTPDGLFSCPSRYGYEPDDYACDYVATCKDCWNREMQEVYHV